MTTRLRSSPLPMPAAIRQRGRRGWIAGVVAGAILGALTLVVPALLPPAAAFGFLAIWLGVTAAIYLGFALQDGAASPSLSR